jgi:phospholipase C
MRFDLKLWVLPSALLAGLFLTGCQGVSSGPVPTPTPTPTPAPTPDFALTVTPAGSGTGTVTSAPAGINCGATCSADFSSGTSVTLTAAPQTGYVFTAWSGACSGTANCTVTLNAATSVTATFSATLQSINHIIVMAQENRSFDSYFGALQQYWAQNGYPAQQFDGLPQFNNPPGVIPTNPGCDPAFPYDPTANPPQLNDCMFDANSPPVMSFHFLTACVENPSPSWNESHSDWNLTNPVDPTPTLDGFVHAAGHDARQIVPPFNDVNGLRGIGYYDGSDLNYYYFMASNFATSDRWFSPVMTRTQPNRMYLLAGTSAGHAYPLTPTSGQVNVPIIFQELQAAGVTWKIYVHPDASGCTTAQCLYQMSYINQFTYGQTILNQYPQNIVPQSQFITDAQNGTLPQFAFLEPPSSVGLDEHPADSDPLPGQPPCCSVQAGAKYVSSLINAVMTGPSWKDSAFIFTFDEPGGFYDHVPPQPTVSPDGIPPSDLLPGDICTVVTGPNCDFTYTGYRVPMIVISPFAKKNYVSHMVADHTAILKLVETRFGVPALTKRDAAQIDMSTEFFDFVNEPWKTPPTPPAQSTTDPCYLDHLP